MHKEFLMGNEAIALGALAAGVNLVSGYPGTPSTEVLETIAKRNPGNVYVEWSINEKAGMEVAAGAAYAGARALVTMKQVGLNVASDPLMSLEYIGVKGGMVVLVADDPGPISSQTEQDTRTFGMFSKVPVFDPASVAEAYEMLQQMNSIFMGYEPWRKNIRPLERFLIREKEKAMVMATPSSYSFIPTDEELADAIISINGKGKALDELQKWLGVCCFVQSCCEYPRDLKTCCERLAALPYKNKLEIPCKFDNVRKIAIYGFVREDYRRWVSYKPNDTEKKNFDSCFDVGKALEKALEK